MRRDRIFQAKSRFAAHALAGLLCLALPVAAQAHFLDPIDTPATMSPMPAHKPLLGLSNAAGKWVAVGSRGMVITADAAGQNWVQSNVPVQSDLNDVQMADATHGWICGHDGVVLATNDGGKNWTKQMDGISARKTFEDYYNQQIAAGNKALAPFLQQIQLNYDNGPSLPWLALYFSDAQTGYVIGSFGDIATTSDGGKTWVPWLDHIDNPQYLDLDAIGNVGGQIYIAGEQGTVYWLDPTQHKFVARPTNYAGAFFGLTGTADAVIVFGLRGTIYRSTDQGKSWTQSTNPSGSTIMNGTVLKDGRVALVNVDGRVLISNDDGKSFQFDPSPVYMPLTDAVQTADGQLLVTGLGGVRTVASR